MLNMRERERDCILYNAPPTQRYLINNFYGDMTSTLPVKDSMFGACGDLSLHTAWSILWSILWAVIQGLGFYSLIQSPSPCRRLGWVREIERVRELLIDRKGFIRRIANTSAIYGKIVLQLVKFKKHFLSIKRFHAVQ